MRPVYHIKKTETSVSAIMRQKGTKWLMKKKPNQNYYVEQQLVDALIALLKHKSLNEISVRELCNQAGVGRASFYRHYQSKEEVLERHARFLIKEWSQELESDSGAKPWDVFESLFCQLKEHQAFYEVLHKTGRDNVLRISLREKIGLTKDLSNSDAYQKVFFADGVSGWIEEWIERGMQETPAELNELFASYFNTVLANLAGIFAHD